METVTDFIFLSSKFPADGNCSHEVKRCLLLGRKDMTKLDSTLKRRDITLLTKVHIVKAMVFSAVMYGCESWLSTKEFLLSNCGAEEDSWETPGPQGDQTSQSKRKSTLNIHSKDWCWSWSSNILATWCKETTHWERPWVWERLKAEGEER